MICIPLIRITRPSFNY